MDDRRARAEAVAGFAAALRELRASVGNPPFREMSGRSGAISHTTLHEATKGNRLPSWETTVEFVKACGADPALFRERWESANLAVRAGSVPARVEAPVGGGEEARPVQVAVASPVAPPEPAPKRGRSNRTVAAALATAVVGVGAVVLAAAVMDGEPDNRKPSDGLTTPALTAADCPVIPTNPPSAPPATRGDASVFIADITLPDCTHVGQGETVTKVWRIKNVGTVTWRGYSLRRLDVPQLPEHCQTITDVPIKDTRPGEMVDIRTEITTPRKPGMCYVRFKMADATGALVFPGSRPLNFQIIVD
ncbi:NBR1-Ig-like domain-containing protein [Actinocorallia sp. A-T 12471]|uniref:NBR1-Ig-like domain-containing protein n=1 Tax=Actinocorallia sp. A-T 12471 TaxID=3089813 RepID=UPI0029D2A997|nr:NBR1-Ig-like domain-containing protein [Actinocorallia sp. A-T 12471]MDX6741999.1 NBR1-Ig-like domain-containing protein [Actinocorallia sp. A-T 12471]